jgi:hypothetical protein
MGFQVREIERETERYRHGTNQGCDGREMIEGTMLEYRCGQC